MICIPYNLSMMMPMMMSVMMPMIFISKLI